MMNLGRTPLAAVAVVSHYDDLLVAGAAWVLVLCAGWAALVCAAAVLEVASEGRLTLTARLGCPARARRALLAGLGVVLAGGGAVVAGPVSAAPAPFSRMTRGGEIDQISGLPVPARPLGPAPSVPRQRVEVQLGDSLWRLSRERSASAASAYDVARLVQRTYRANRRVIGPDPDLIQPGMRLRIPVQRHTTPPPLETP